ncbi:MAG: sensor histidine kinase KdpD [Clostridiales bacterium]|uniref:sensor histidine kinase n=1 Tax=Provencibacterium massiliense TaxID=1841868 RepID=UPI0009A80F2B|nr:sensor histidine kinase KdpD [Provencibacterium massiliense]PWM41155.1 MAG: sensor histidine kinase KdpD [Clostridiales bacterium]RGB67923.1 sensor histidine kinase KdpD [Harryflintia acetispora]
MREDRSSPEELLRQIKMEEDKKGRGSLKIFFGYAAGVGKTYAMLKAAHAEQKRGCDVVVGYVEAHARPQTAQLLQGLELLPTRRVAHGGITLCEFDLDAAIKRRPQLILVDELAHTNAEGCRHLKRYQDVNELLEQGIDVYTTVNVQHIESLNDLVASITGVTVKERIPDSVFDGADQVKLVDIEPKELIERLGEGKVYQKPQAERALYNFFTEQNLVALREIALRRTADRVNRMAERSGRRAGGFADEHILVCLSSSPTNPKIIRTAARMASAFHGNFTALFVETPDFPGMSEENRGRLRRNIHLAQQLGATIETAYGEDVAFQIAEFARLAGVSKIVLGRSSARRRLLPGRPSLTERITRISPSLDIYIIPDQNTPRYKPKRRPVQRPKNILLDLCKSLLALGISTAIGYLFDCLGFSEANIITVYILGVLVTAVITSHRSFSLVGSLISVLLFNFFFTEPRFTLSAYDAGYPATFLIMLAAAFLTSSLAARIKRQARQSAETAFRTKILFDTNRQLGSEQDADGIVSVTCNQLQKLLGKDVIFYSVGEEGLRAPQFFPAHPGIGPDAYTTGNERAVASWVYHNNKHAGATTNTLGDSKCLYLSVRVGTQVYGVVGLVIGGAPLDAFENSIVLSILGECALALKNERTTREREEAALLAKNEQLRANLLRSISHDLRTPLTSISGNAGILLSSEESIDKGKRRQLYADIYDDSLWLINLVENLLSVTRIEDGTMKLRLTTELLEEIIGEALQHTDRRRSEHDVQLKADGSLLLVKADARLIMQVVINLVDNAVKYTPPGSQIVIETKREGTMAVVTVRDNGGGISDEAKKHIFDMFYTAGAGAADSRRSLGLGLALCKSIVTAHGGNITVGDNQPHGAVFTFTLPMEEVMLHE